jgi:hypothetical protein
VKSPLAADVRCEAVRSCRAHFTLGAEAPSHYRRPSTGADPAARATGNAAPGFDIRLNLRKLRGHFRKTLLNKVPLMSLARQIAQSDRYDDPGRYEFTHRTRTEP